MEEAENWFVQRHGKIQHLSQGMYYAVKSLYHHHQTSQYHTYAKSTKNQSPRSALAYSHRIFHGVANIPTCLERAATRPHSIGSARQVVRCHQVKKTVLILICPRQMNTAHNAQFLFEYIKTNRTAVYSISYFWGVLTPLFRYLISLSRNRRANSCLDTEPRDTHITHPSPRPFRQTMQVGRITPVIPPHTLYPDLAFYHALGP